MNENSPLLSIEGQSPLGEEDRHKKYSGKELACTSNVLVGGICGLVYMTNFVNIGLLADNLGTTSVKLGSVFIGEAIAAVLGGLFFPSVAHYWDAANSIILSLGGLAVICTLIMFCTSTVFMYFLYFFTGLLTSFIDTGSVAVVRVMFQGDVAAGPWLSAMAIAFLLGGVVASFLNAIFSSVIIIYSIVVFLIVVVFIFNWLYQERFIHCPPLSLDTIVWNSYTVELLVGLTMGMVDGSSTIITSYLQTYIEETGVVSDSLKSYVVVVFWAAMLVGEIAVLLTQTKQSMETLMTQQAIVAGCSVLALIFVAIFAGSGMYLWIAMGIVGFCNGTAFCVLSDIANRLCRPTALSATIVFFGVCLGISGLPYVVSAVWDYTGAGPLFFVYLLIGVQSLTLVVQIAPRMKHVEL